jgi:hypothetical protein
VRRRLRPRVLVEAGERRLIAAGDARQAVAEHPLGVGEVADHFLHRPLAVGIRIVALVLGQRRQPFELRDLLREEPGRTAVGHFAHVAGVKSSELGCVWSSDGHRDP